MQLSRGGGEIFLEKGKDIFVWCSALKVSGRWRNNADEVLAKLFFGERICQNFGSLIEQKTNAYEIPLIFEEQVHKQPRPERLDRILITERGKKGDKITGIITSWDLGKVL